MSTSTRDTVISSPSILERFRLTDRTAVVTGGAQGIGRALAHAVSEAGARVAILDTNFEKATSVEREIEEKGGAAIAIHADVTEESSIEQAFLKVKQTFKTIDILVNNAGISKWCESERQEKIEWDQIIALNLTGVFLCCKHAAASMLTAGYGKIINIASMSGHIVNVPQNQAAYNTSKAGVLHLTRSLAAEWATKGVRVNSISPGYTLTSLVQDLLETELGKKVMPVWMDRTPVHAMLDVTDLQGAAVFLASPASDFVTGSDLLVDGGYCAW